MEDCIVCHESHPQRQLCGHLVHDQCILSWIDAMNIDYNIDVCCPLCRQLLPNLSGWTGLVTITRQTIEWFNACETFIPFRLTPPEILDQTSGADQTTIVEITNMFASQLIGANNDELPREMRIKKSHRTFILKTTF